MVNVVQVSLAVVERQARAYLWSSVDILPEVGDGFTETEEWISDPDVVPGRLPSQLQVLDRLEHGVMQSSRLQVVIALRWTVRTRTSPQSNLRRER